MGFSMACDQATRLSNITCVVSEFFSIGMSESPACCEQNGFRRCHIPIFGALLPDREMYKSVSPRRIVATPAHTAHSDGIAKFKCRNQFFQALISVTATGNQGEIRLTTFTELNRRCRQLGSRTRCLPNNPNPKSSALARVDTKHWPLLMH